MLKIQIYITGINYILQYVQIENSYLKLLNCFYNIFDQINAVLVSLRLLSKLLKKRLNSSVA